MNVKSNTLSLSFLSWLLWSKCVFERRNLCDRSGKRSLYLHL